MVMVTVFALVVVIMICGGVLIARLATVAKSKSRGYGDLSFS